MSDTTERDLVMSLLDEQIQALEAQAEEIVKDMAAMYQPCEDKQSKEYMALAKQWVEVKRRKIEIVQLKSDLTKLYDALDPKPIVIRIKL